MPIEALKKRIKATEDLREIVSNMKMLSSVSINQYERANAALDKYRRNIKDAFHALALHNQLPNFQTKVNLKRRYLYILIGSDNGMVGRYNKEITEKVNIDLKQRHILRRDVLFLVVGKRLAMQVQALGWNAWTMYAGANSVKAVTPLAESIILKIDEATQKEKVTNVCVWFHQKRTNAGVSLDKREIIPVALEQWQKLKKQKWETNNIPMVGLPAKKMLSALINETLMITMSKLINASLAAEHFTRMTNMQNAEQNIDENLAEMNLIYQQQRQEYITDELIDIISGAEAMKKTAG